MLNNQSEYAGLKRCSFRWDLKTKREAVLWSSTGRRQSSSRLSNQVSQVSRWRSEVSGKKEEYGWLGWYGGVESGEEQGYGWPQRYEVKSRNQWNIWLEASKASGGPLKDSSFACIFELHHTSNAGVFGNDAIGRLLDGLEFMGWL